MSRDVLPVPDHVVDKVLRLALEEDLGRAGDITTNAVIPQEQYSHGKIVARGAGTIAGLAAATRVFATLDPRVEVVIHVDEGAAVEAGSVLADVNGPTRAMLTGERTCLNLVGHLSGIATKTATMQAAVEGTNARIVDTRKTLPGLRALEKYAVRAGGGANHRFGLDDSVLIKDNHIAALGSIEAAVLAAKAKVGHPVKIELEVDTLEQLEVALEIGVDVVLLDNMGPETLRKAVAMVDGRCLTEASGGVTIETVRSVAETGVDLIAVGALTHSAPQLDIGLDM